jgi:hypothetical protein
MSRTGYHQQIEAARRVGLTMTKTQLEEFAKLLRQYADRLAGRVALGFATGDERVALRIAREILDDLTRELAKATRTGVVTTARQIEEIHARALLELGSRHNFGGLATRVAQAVLSRPELSASFKTIRRDSVAAVDRILKRAALRGAGTQQVARELRLHILGADAFPDRLLLDRRRIGYAAIREMGYEPTPENLAAVRKDAGKVAARAQLIARAEPMNAEQEAQVQAAIESPVIEAIQWERSGRGEPCPLCDALAQQDWYGLGPGRYDPRRVPPRPHPRCICRMRSVLRPARDFGKPRGSVPRRRVSMDEIGELYEMSPSQAAQLASAFDVAEHRGENAA